MVCNFTCKTFAPLIQLTATFVGFIIVTVTNMTDKKSLLGSEDDPYQIIASPRAVCSHEGELKVISRMIILI